VWRRWQALTVNPEAKLQTVEDRFRLDLSNEEAEMFFMGLIMESMSHVGIQARTRTSLAVAAFGLRHAALLQVLEGFHNLARILR
jgi:hypothetical protein